MSKGQYRNITAPEYDETYRQECTDTGLVTCKCLIPKEYRPVWLSTAKKLRKQHLAKGVER